jgi:2-amino-4-hydroxy-6-hydroxymethyldihydropteridine diphosphokinase
LSEPLHLYLIALGSNMRTVRDGPPRKVIEAAVEVLEDVGLLFHAISPVIDSAPVGPSQRWYANAAAVVETQRGPETMLGLFKGIEQVFGRRRGQRWASRVLDLDIVLWNGGIWASETLIIPHPQFRTRGFVLQPAKAIAGDWRDPVSNLSVAQLYARLTKPRPVPR